MTRPQRFLAVAGVPSAAIAVLHLVMIFAGSDAYVYFGAPQLASLERQGSVVPDLVTGLLVLVFSTFAYYAFAGAGRAARRPPLLALGLAAIGTIFTLRGLLIVLELWRLVSGPGHVPHRYLVFSLVSLLTGLCYSAGTLLQWRVLRARPA